MDHQHAAVPAVQQPVEHLALARPAEELRSGRANR
jgi:hypothetical protein